MLSSGVMASSDYSEQPPLTGAPSGEPSVQPLTEPAGGSPGAASAAATDAPAPVEAAPAPAAVVQFSENGRVAIRVSNALPGAKATCRVTTSGGRQQDRTINFEVIER